MEDINKLIKRYFGFTSFQGMQEKVINRLTDERKHCLVLMPTGSGKSLCYQAPALAFDGGSIVISPLIALMKDQVDALKRKNIPAAYINSTVPKNKREERIESFIAGRYKLLYVTPERFRIPDFVKKITKATISLLAIDEAHCISEWGHDFRPDYSRIAEFRSLLNNPLTIALTATATPEVQKDIIQKTGLSESEVKIFHEGIERPNLKLKALDVYTDEEKIDAIISTSMEFIGPGIVYFSLIKTLEQFSETLRKKGVKHFIYHGKLNNADRRLMQNEFMKSPDMMVLATNAFGMGIDKPDIRYVIHAEMPGSIESYYQEIGRAGRDGKTSICLLLYREMDLAIQMDFIKWSNPDSKFYGRLFGLLADDMMRVNSGGIEYLKEQLVFKNRNDFRLETALGMLDRYGASEGDIEKRNLVFTGYIPNELLNDSWLNEKLLRDRKRLLSVVQYFKNSDCRKIFISEYFGIPATRKCGVCDLCEGDNNLK